MAVEPGERLSDLASLRIDRDALEARRAGGGWIRYLAAIVVREGRASIVAVKLGPEVDGRLEITSRLEGGETLGVNPTDQIREGTRVRLRSKS